MARIEEARQSTILLVPHYEYETRKLLYYSSRCVAFWRINDDGTIDPLDFNGEELVGPHADDGYGKRHGCLYKRGNHVFYDDGSEVAIQDLDAPLRWEYEMKRDWVPDPTFAKHSK